MIKIYEPVAGQFMVSDLLRYLDLAEKYEYTHVYLDGHLCTLQVAKREIRLYAMPDAYIVVTRGSTILLPRLELL